MNNIAYILSSYKGCVLDEATIACLAEDIDSEVLVSCLAPVRITAALQPYDRPSNKTLVVDAHERVAKWVANMVDCDADVWPHAVAIGLEHERELVAGVVFESYTGTNCNIHVAGVGSHWLNRTLLFTTFDFAFNKLGVKRLTALVPAENTKAIEFDKNLGFELEAVMKNATAQGDLLVLVMFRDSCRFLGDSHDGRKDKED